MFKKYRLKEKYRKKLSHFLTYQMKMMITVSLVVVGMSSLLTNVYAQNEVYGIYKNDNKVYECDLGGNSIRNEIDIKDVTYLYIAGDVTTIYDKKKSPNDQPKVHTVHFIDDNVETIGFSAFSNFVNLSGTFNLSNQANLKMINSRAFVNTQLTEIQLPASVNDISNDAFGGCRTLEKISVPAGNTTYYSQDGVLFKKASGNDKETLWKYPEGKTGNDYTIPDGIEIINDYSFVHTNIKNVTIPATVTDIKTQAFFYSQVEKVLFQTGSQLKNIGEFAFQNSALNNIDLPDGLETINVCAFNLTQLSTINIPQSVTSIKYAAFHNVTMTAINVAENNQNYQSDDGVLYTKDGKNIIQYPAGKSINTYTIQKGTETIEDSAFDYSLKTPYVVIPNSVNQIEDSAFSNSKIKGILFEGRMPTFNGIEFFKNANADVKLYTLNSDDTGFNTSINKTIELYKEPKLSIESIHESQVGKTYQIQPTLNDNATFKNDIGYTYTSTDPTIASVNQSGLVTMHKAGTTSIKVTAADPFRKIEKIMTVDVKEEINNNGNQETPPTDPDGSTPNQPETVIPNQPEIKPQENQEISGTNSQENKKESKLNHQVKTNDETMIIGIIGLLLLSGIAIFSLRKKEI